MSSASPRRRRREQRSNAGGIPTRARRRRSAPPERPVVFRSPDAAATTAGCGQDHDLARLTRAAAHFTKAYRPIAFVGRVPANSRSKCVAVAFWRNRDTLAGRRRALVYVARCSLVPAQLAPERAEMVEAARHQGREPDAGLFLRLVELHRQIHIADIERAAGVGAEDQLKTETLRRKATSASARAPSASSLSPAGSCWRRSRSGASSERSRS